MKERNWLSSGFQDVDERGRKVSYTMTFTTKLILALSALSCGVFLIVKASVAFQAFAANVAR